MVYLFNGRLFTICLLCCVSLIPFLRLCTTANAIVHTFMYYYYLMAILRVPVWWKVTMHNIFYILFHSNTLMNTYEHNQAHTPLFVFPSATCLMLPIHRYHIPVSDDCMFIHD